MKLMQLQSLKQKVMQQQETAEKAHNLNRDFKVEHQEMVLELSNYYMVKEDKPEDRRLWMMKDSARPDNHSKLICQKSIEKH